MTPRTHSRKSHQHTPTTTTMPSKMLERVLSLRRAGPQHGEEGSGDNDDGTADESKTKKQQQLPLTTRAAHYLTRMGPMGPCLAFLCLTFLAILSLLIFHSRPFVCVSSYYNPVSRSGFFGLDGLESDFGSLGVPWCKPFSLPGSHPLDLNFISFGLRYSVSRVCIVSDPGFLMLDSD
jgi:hypothetical protein